MLSPCVAEGIRVNRVNSWFGTPHPQRYVTELTPTRWMGALPRNSAEPPSRPVRFGLTLLIAAGGAILILLYLRVADDLAQDSDTASLVLQGQAIANGNVLLHGWYLPQDTFWLSDASVYAVLVTLRGLTPNVAQDLPVLVYVMLVACATMLAKGVGRNRSLSCLITTVLLLVPAPGIASSILLRAPFHVSTTLLIVVILLGLDRSPCRRITIVRSILLLTLSQVCDPLATYIAAVPIILVCGLRLLARKTSSVPFDSTLGVAAAVSILAALTVVRASTHFGGLQPVTIGASFAPLSEVPGHILWAAEGTLALFGADPGRPLSGTAVVKLFHLVGVFFVSWAVWHTLRRWRIGEERTLVHQLLAAFVIVDLAAFIFSTQPIDIGATRYLVPAFVLGAVLAGRIGGGFLTQRKAVRPTLAIIALYATTSIWTSLTVPPAGNDQASLAAWLQARGLSYGLAGYWQANIVTLESSGKVSVRSVKTEDHHLAIYRWYTDVSWYDPNQHEANFVVVDNAVPAGELTLGEADAITAFGQPQYVDTVGHYKVLVWSHNLLLNVAPG